MLEKPSLTWEEQNQIYPEFTCPVSTKDNVDRIPDRLLDGGASFAKLSDKYDRKMFAFFVTEAPRFTIGLTEKNKNRHYR